MTAQTAPARKAAKNSLPNALRVGDGLYEVLDPQTGRLARVDLTGDMATVEGSENETYCVRQARAEAERIAKEAAVKLPTPTLLRLRNRALRFEVLEAVNETLYERGYRGLA